MKPLTCYFMASFIHIKTLTRAKALGILFLLLPAISIIAQPGIAPGDVFSNGYQADACYRHLYKAPGRLDTVGKMTGAKVYRVWRVVRLDNLVNKSLFAAPEKDCTRNDLFEVLKYGIRNGKISAYGSPEMKGPALDWRVVEKTLLVNDTASESYISNQRDTVTTKNGSVHKMHSSELAGYVVCEDWYMDSKGIRRSRRIISICPVYDREGDKQPDKPLFYVNYNECRDLLSSFRATADEKGADMTFDEVFVKKSFESIVVKTENVYTHSFATFPNSSQDESTIAIQKLLK